VQAPFACRCNPRCARRCLDRTDSAKPLCTDKAKPNCTDAAGLKRPALLCTDRDQKVTLNPSESVRGAYARFAF
jgi:hypothetical protein